MQRHAIWPEQAAPKFSDTARSPNKAKQAQVRGASKAGPRPQLSLQHGESPPDRFLAIPTKGPLQRVHEALVLRQNGALPLDVGDHPLLRRPSEAADYKCHL